jgi:hypothetical protein
MDPDYPVYFFLDLAVAAGFSAFGGGGLPITPLSGQILKAGHFSQLLTTAIGQRVMVYSNVVFVGRSMRFATVGG